MKTTFNLLKATGFTTLGFILGVLGFSVYMDFPVKYVVLNKFITSKSHTNILSDSRMCFSQVKEQISKNNKISEKNEIFFISCGGVF